MGKTMPLDLQRIQAALPGREIHWFPTIDSTMYEAVRRAAAGAPSGTIVGADEQTAGHGRYQRTWHSERDTGLYQTFILRLPLPTAQLPAVTLALGLAAAQAIQRVAGIATDLRWPNDVLIGDRKCAGILVQLHDGAIIAGIGINVNQSEFPPDVAAIATSLRLASGEPQCREDLLIGLAQEIDAHCAILTGKGMEAILSMFDRASSYVSGRRVVVDDAITGTTAGLTAEGFLRLVGDNGVEQIIHAGGVRPCF